MEAVDPRTPCLIGVAQQTYRGEHDLEPLDMWEQVSVNAARDAGNADIVRRLDSAQIVYCQSWGYDDPTARLAGRLGASPRHSLYSGIGGNTPQLLLQRAAQDIAAGDYDLALVTGAESIATVRRYLKQGAEPEWSYPKPGGQQMPFDEPFHPAEQAHQVFMAITTFPMFDVARRHRLGVDPESYRERLGRLLAPMTEVAANNPHAWFTQAREAGEIIHPGEGNRMVSYPYTKRMVAMMDVDMASALLVASEEQADALGVPLERRVYPRGWCYAADPSYLAERGELSSSPAMQQASAAALDSAGIGIDDVAHLDLYSCFSSALNLARDALGIAEDDPRPVTVTGGLPYFGGPASNYMTHAIASMADTLREDPGSFGVVSGIGMHMAKHAYGVYSTTPGPLRPADEEAVQQRVDNVPRRTIRDTYTGEATVATYTINHGRDGAPDWGVAICEVDGGDRCYGRIADPDLLAHAEEADLVGERVRLETVEDGVNMLTP